MKTAPPKIRDGQRFFNSFIDTVKHAPQPFSAPLEDAVDFALSGLSPKPRDPRLKKTVLDATLEVDLGAMNDQIRHETYMDVIKSNHLRSSFAIRNTNLDRLEGIAPNELRTFGGVHWSDEQRGDEVDAVLAIAFANVELRLAQFANCLDCSTVSPIGHVLRGKVERTLGAANADRAFANLKEVSGIPDVGEGILEKQFTTDELVKVRSTRDAEQFRQWFHEKCSEDPRQVVREYCALLRQVPKIQSLPARVMRCLPTNLTSFLPGGVLLGPVIGTVDSFFVDRWLRGPSPKYFLDSLADLPK